MKCQVLGMKKTSGGLPVAHIRVGDLFGDVLATKDVIGPGEYELKVTLREKEGRLVPLARVEK